MFKSSIAILTCIALFAGQLMFTSFAQADSQNLSHQGNELNTVNAQTIAPRTNPEKERLVKSKSDFAFGAQLGDFSLNYLMFITHYLAGATMPVFCKNSVLSVPAGPPGIFLPNLWIDNIIFSIGSIVYLYFELLISDSLQKKNKVLEESLKTCPPGSQESCQDAEHGESFHLKALDVQYQALDFELEILSQKAEATRATKTAWLLSAVLSLATYVTIGNYPDICLGMYPATLPFLGPTLKDAFQNFQQQLPAPSKPPLNTFIAPDSFPATIGIQQREVLKIFEKANDFDSLALALTELQLTKLGVVPKHDEFEATLSFNISDDDFRSMKQWFIKALKGELLGKLNSLLSTAVAATAEQEFDETLAAKQELTEAQNLSDFFSVYKDVNSMFNTTANVVNMTQDSSFADDYKKLSVDPVGESQKLAHRMISQQFFKQFADYLGFRNGGETAFLIYLTVIGDLVVLKSRSLLANPLVPSLFPVVAEGSFLFKIVSSVVGAYFADAYRQEVLAAKLKIIALKKTISATIQSIKDREKDGGLTVVSPPLQKGGNTTASAQTSEGLLCFSQSSILGPDSLSICSAANDVNAAPVVPLNFGSNNFNQAIGQVGVNASETSENLTSAFNRLAVGNVRGARGNLRALGNSGAQMAALLKTGLGSFHKLNPHKKIKDELANTERNISARIQMALAAAKYKGGILQLSPSSPISYAGISAPSETISRGTRPLLPEQLHRVKSTGVTLPIAPSKLEWHKKNKIDHAAESEFREALAKEYDFIQDDINNGSEQNIFEVITLRYFKTAYPVFFKRKDLPKE
ncbi:MAG: hypothetical protein A2X86_17730 [Bdellovibrionales bacterium GWA2_49_15]|nr:MAG: hypothetical protein A2X86_17730 [Bdellovibrionales bacterium GWA2_49_15]HAZ14989.1 hypothetical protein [Bdellovibrionales bacterium]